MNASKIFVQLLMGVLLIWFFVESTTGASSNMQKHELKGLEVNIDIEVDATQVTETTNNATTTTDEPIKADIDVIINPDVDIDIKLNTTIDVI